MQKTANGYRDIALLLPILLRGSRRLSDRPVSKILRVMRLLTFFLFTAFLTAHATGVSQTVTLTGRNMPLKKVFSAIEKQTGYFVFFVQGALAPSKSVSVDVSNMPLDKFLATVLQDQPLSYKMDDRTIFLFQKPPMDFLDQLAPPVVFRVLSPDGKPLSGASFSKNSSQNKVTLGLTDAKGVLSLDVTAGERLLVSFVGFEPFSFVVTDEMLKSGFYSFKLNLSVSKLDEMVVVGYGEQAKREVTGAISRVDMENTAHLPNTNLTEALHGRIAGVQFTSDDRPGQNGSILIHGQRSLSASNSPLVVLDGAVFNGSIADINPQDIQSMEVLKDASAAAIYGSRAANGVILVTSKKGTTGKPTIHSNSYYGIADFSYKPRLLSADRYIQFIKDYNREIGNDIDDEDITSYLPANVAENYENGIITDPWEVVSQSAVNSSVNLSLSGKSDNVSYYISGGRTNEQGLIMNSQQKRTTVKANLEAKVTDWLSVGINSNYSVKDVSGAVPDMEQVVRSIPYASWYHEDGEPRRYTVDGEQVSRNPLWEPNLITNQDVEKNIFAKFYAYVQFPFLKGLSYRFRYAPNTRWINTYQFERQDLHESDDLTSAKKYNRRAEDWMIENIVKYQKRFLGDHKIDVTLLYGTSHRGMENTTASGERFSPDILGWNDLNLALDQHIFSYGETTNNQISYMGRVNYGYKDKYYLTLTVRRDGCSVFAKNNKFGTFPSGAFGWVVSDEDFLSGLNFLNFLKLRVSYGAVGNQAISPYQSLSLLETNNYAFGSPATTSLGVYPLNMANDDLKWETSYKASVGIDFSLFDRRVSGTVNLYNTDTKDLLMKRSLPRMTGFTGVETNLGEINNKGIDVSLTTQNVKTKSFNWETNIVFSSNRNRIVHLYYSDVDKDGKEDDDVGNNWFINEPISVYYDYVFDGIFQSTDDIAKSAQPGAFLGDVKLKDMNPDGKITPDDRRIVGQLQPKFSLGIANTFKYKRLSLSFFVNAMGGWIGSFSRAISAGRSLNFVDRGWWTPDNHLNTMPSINYQNQYGISYYEKRDFIRIQDVTLSYDLPEQFLNKIGLPSCSFYLSGKNLHTFTKWMGPDPESGYATLGNYYPLARTYAVGIDISL